MQAVLFTKLFHGCAIDEIGRITSDLGFEGIDLLIRAGFQVDPAGDTAYRRAVGCKYRSWRGHLA